MDYRLRDYYLIKIDHPYYNKIHKELKTICPSIEFHAPYGHYRVPEWKRDYKPYDGENITNIDGSIIWWQELISVRKDTPDLTYFMMYSNVIDRLYPGSFIIRNVNKFTLNQ